MTWLTDGKEMSQTDSLSARITRYQAASRRGKYKFRAPRTDTKKTKKSDDDDEVQRLKFGEADKAEVAKAHQARKRKQRSAKYAEQKKAAQEIDPKEQAQARRRRKRLLNSLLATPASEEELAELREIAKQAMLAARKRASGPVKFCCGAIRPADYKCPLNGKHGPISEEVNSWQ